MIFKRITAAAVCCMMAVSAAGCSMAKADKNKNSKLSVVCTIFPEYDWARQVIGELDGEISVSYLMENGADLHNFQPSAEDILGLSACDVFIYVGGESDKWVEDAIKEADNKDMKVIDLMDILKENVKEEEEKEGMQGEEEEGSREDEPEYDEHLWLSLKNAQIACTEIGKVLGEVDKDNAETYENNAKAYNEKLGKLDNDFQQLADNAENKTLIFGDRFPFRYFTDDYGLDYYAAFVGCSAETEASFETVTFLANKLDELGNRRIYTIENSDQKLARSIIDNTKSKDQEIAVLDSLQSVTTEQVEKGVTYLSIMQKNYDTLKEDLGGSIK